ncbi:arsenate reductase/protein-tyrosine-phosphatase family protein [Leucobacter japonicus]|uniref:arsenate reductase/protein-tyrosine-phosphatase family protein n=1 Tax=Leucobacter japonicus TaxID=1461259 RepID=UPI0006A782DA|nr:hypothetical protein [Leucobacter japonicus]
MSETACVLVVCTANICRSPYVAARLQAALRDADIRVESAGTRARPGMEMAADSVAQLVHRGIHPDPAFRSRQVTASMIDRATVVLTMTREHRAQVLDISPVALKRTLTLREFAGLVRAGEPTADAMGARDAWTSAVRSCISRRGQHPELVSGPEADLKDPYGLGTAAFVTMADTVEHAVRGISAASMLR